MNFSTATTSDNESKHIFNHFCICLFQVTVSVEPGVQLPPHRYFHSACYVNSRRSMYIYGGLSGSKYLSDIWSFNVDSESWKLLDRPFVHTHNRIILQSPVVNSKISSSDPDILSAYTEGGIGSAGAGDGGVASSVDGFSISDDDVDGGGGGVGGEAEEYQFPPPLAGHTLTYCNDDEKEVLVLIGGVSDVHGFLDVVWEYSISTGVWSVLNTSGTIPQGIFGHTTVYHSQDNVFYVYGGYSYMVDKVVISEQLYALHYPSKVWTLLPTDTKINQNSASRPAPRAFHTAVTTRDYLLIIGGHIEEKRDLQQTLMVYSYKCNMWIPLNQYFITLAGPELHPLVGLSSAIHNDIVYVYGGYNGVTRGRMMSITIPQDLCTLNANKSSCGDRIGCANCVVYDGVTNTSYCYSNADKSPPPRECFGKSGGGYPGEVCNASLLQRDCSQYSSCAACLARYPAVPGSEQKCKWCRNCSKGKCIPKDNDCTTENICDSSAGVQEENLVMLDADACIEKSCAASDCAKCKKLKQCIWTRQVLRPKKVFTLNSSPIYNWNCVAASIRNHSRIESSPPSSCPNRCLHYDTCNSCLSSNGAEGGWQQCYWSQTLNVCLSPSYVPLRCLGGKCGTLLQTLPCPKACSQYKTCSTCLKHPQCGWCGLHTDVGGLGVCTRGDLKEPTASTCSKQDYSHLVSNASIVALHKLSGSAPPPDVSWHYLKCPAEDECRSGHHDCHPKTQRCVDRKEGYSCHCASGYNTSSDGSCLPLCQQGCHHGTCIQPNNCSCHFGYVGVNCSIKCKCNGNADCLGEDKLSHCKQCHNNTRGDQCQKCNKFYVGDPAANRSCISCYDYCNTHASKCFPRRDKEERNRPSASLVSESGVDTENDDYEAFTEATCSACSNNTSGHSCETCLPGYFRGSTDLRKPCKPCECNGHSNTCDPIIGDKCDCYNNTVSPCTNKGSNLSGKDEEDCQKKQCTKCKELYLGNPSKGHQCYFQMTVDEEYCLDPESQSRCDTTPKELNVGQTVYFAVQPKFLNVNIRLILDVNKGGVKVYFSSREDTFLVSQDERTWRHKIKVDPKYSLAMDDGKYPYSAKSVKSSYVANNLNVHDIINSTPLSRKSECSSPTCINKQRTTSGSTHKNITRYSPIYRLIETTAYGLKTFITVKSPTDILIVDNVTNRLVITLPQHGHDLRSAKFYLVVEGTGDLHETSLEASVGSVFFRQDQPRIDLFVFFSVFFSCFFLFLAVCVVVWKIKQNIDHRRARRRHVVEMLHMARRPFAVTTLIMQDTSSSVNGGVVSGDGREYADACVGCEVPPQDPPPWSPGRRKRPTLKKDHNRGGTGGGGGQTGDTFEVGPVAIEPTDDGVAAVVTCVIQFPGFNDDDEDDSRGEAPTHRLALGSALTLMSRVYPNAIIKPFQLRRRASHGMP